MRASTKQPVTTELAERSEAKRAKSDNESQRVALRNRLIVLQFGSGRLAANHDNGYELNNARANRPRVIELFLLSREGVSPSACGDNAFNMRV